jgi:hypothetical protein
VTQASGKAVKIFVGASAQSPVKADGLKDGAYRIATGSDWMALIGEDTEFMPIEPWSKGHADFRAGTLVAIWAQKKDSPGELYGDIHSARIVLKK